MSNAGYIKEVDDIYQVYCKVCGMVHEVPKALIRNRGVIEQPIPCHCGESIKYILGNDKDKKKASVGAKYFRTFVFLAGGIVLTLWIYSHSKVGGWIFGVFAFLVNFSNFGSMIPTDNKNDPEVVKKGRILDSFNSHLLKLGQVDQARIGQDLQTAIAADVRDNQICVMYSDLEFAKVFAHTEIFGVEVIDDGKVLIAGVRKNKAAQVVSGAIEARQAASLSRRTGKTAQQGRAHRMDLKITLNDPETPTVVINFMNDTKPKTAEDANKDRPQYTIAKERIAEWYELLHAFIRMADEEKTVTQVQAPSPAAVQSSTRAPIADETNIDALVKLANLHKEGFLSKEEFEAEKKKLIGV